MHTSPAFVAPTQTAAVETYQFARRGAEWFLKQLGAKDPIEVYLNMSPERALVHALDRVKGYGGILRIHDEDGFMTEERTFPQPTHAMSQLSLQAGALAA